MADYATLLRDHVTLTCRPVDRIFLQAYVPRLQSVGMVCQFLRWQRGYPIPSSAAFGKIGDGCVAEVHEFAKANGIPVRHFVRGEKKKQIARPYIEAAAAGGGSKVALIGIAQEKASVWRSWKARGQEHAAHPHMEWGRQMAFINHFYFYLRDAEWGPAFWKTNAYAPWPVWIWLNGHEWAKRQLAKAGVGFTALDNGFASCQDPALLQRLCDRLGPGAVTGFFWRWQARLPSPFTRDDLRAGYVYDLAFRQFEISGTRMFGRPAAGRAFFEGLIRDHLDPGRPDQVSLVSGRKIRLAGPAPAPGTFRTKVITRGVDPEITCYYKSSRIKQYFKEHRALRTELVICDTRDFGVGRRLTYASWNALRDVGDHANQRLCDAEAADALPAPDVATLNQVTRPSLTTEGQHAPALRFGDARVMAVLAAITGFCHLITGFDNHALAQRMRSLLDEGYSSRQATYDLRRLRRKQIIYRIEGTHRYQLTPAGRAVAVLFTKAYGRILGPGLAALDPGLPGDLAKRSPLATAWKDLDRQLDRFIDHGLAPA
ncbi:MAG: hypothetical protein ACRDOK_28350 [Streptosporangiaceae bacterium]